MFKEIFNKRAGKLKLLQIFFIIQFVIFFISYNIEATISNPKWLAVGSNASNSINQNQLEAEVWYTISGTDTQTGRYIFTASQIDEECWKCHADIYPDVPVFADRAKKRDVSGFTSPNKTDHSYPLFYSRLNNTKDDANKRLGHRSHVVRQPFGVGRNCLDCHSVYYKSVEHENQKQANSFTYFKKSTDDVDGMVSLNVTDICSDCHGGFYPKERNPNTITRLYPDPAHPDKRIDPTDVTILEWGNPATVECLHCHDDSVENGGIYASYVSRYSNNTSSIWGYADDTYSKENNEFRIFSPDPDKVSGYNYWTKNGHGLYISDRYPGALLDTGYPYQNTPFEINYPNKGAMKENDSNLDLYREKFKLDIGVHNSKILGFGDNYPSVPLTRHDINLEPNDGGLNFCWECHWSNIMVSNTITNHLNSDFSMGKYNGHLDTIKRDERWGDPENFELAPHYQVTTCRRCHENKYSHYVYPALTPYSLGLLNRSFVQSPYLSDVLERLYIIAPNGPLWEEKPLYYCVACHNPHGSGTYNGKSNLFMIKGQIYKNHCKNCHYSQHAEHFSPGADAEQQTERDDRKPVIFLNASQQDSAPYYNECGTCHEAPDEPTEDELEYHGTENPVETTDICETCHIGIPNQTNSTINPSHNGNNHIWENERREKETVDYRGSDCTACHMHDPWPLPNNDNNKKAFAPTCRCHDRDENNRYDPTRKGDLSYGKGHAIPPGKYPGIYPADFENDYSMYTEDNPDPHIIHARYNFPCQRCHTDPDLLKDADPTNNTWIPLDFDGSKTMGFDAMNPGASYTLNAMKCDNLYCHSNGSKQNIADSTIKNEVRWDDGPFRLEPDSTDSCDRCHLYPPDGSNNSTAHPPEATQCDSCHPHKGNWEQTPQFYKHVNGVADLDDMGMAWRDGDGATDCGGCHNYGVIDSSQYPQGFSDIKDVHVTVFSDKTDCKICHINVHKDPNTSLFYKDSGMATDKVDSLCKACHMVGDDYSPIENILQEPLDNEMKAVIKSMQPEHLKQNQGSHEQFGCLGCHEGINLVTGHYKEDPITDSMNETLAPTSNSCGTCHTDPRIKGLSRRLHDTIADNCSICHGSHREEDYWKYCEDSSDGSGLSAEDKCLQCHNKITISWSLVANNHVADENCLTCHPGVCQSDSSGQYRLNNSPAPYRKHYLGGANSFLSIGPNGMDSVWRDDQEGTHCGVCHNVTRITPANIKNIHHTDLSGEECQECHFNFHSDSPSSIFYKQMGPIFDYTETDRLCILCHRGTISGGSSKYPHNADSSCLSCHKGLRDLGNIKHYNAPPRSSKMYMESSWDRTLPNACGMCHSDTVLSRHDGQLTIHATIPPTIPCSECHGTHNDMNYFDASFKCAICHGTNPIIQSVDGIPGPLDHITYDGTPANIQAIQDCLACHSNVLNGGETNRFLHMDKNIYVKEGACVGCHSLSRVRHGLTDSMGCYQCHFGEHGNTVYTDSQACIWCHTDNPPIMDICGKDPGVTTTHLSMESSFQNKINISDCLSCHYEPNLGGEANPAEHRPEEYPQTQTYVNNKACLGCHTVSRVPHGTSGLPFAGGIWPEVDCYLCHPDHCETVYTQNEACIWCHTDNPPIKDICGKAPGTITSHLSMESSFQNKINISNCLSCHLEPNMGGETNPYQHMDDPITYVNNNACFGCHTVSRVPHGKSGLPFAGGIWPQVDCYLCHPNHCETVYNKDEACIWCHTPDPLIIDVCGQNRGITKHTLFESTPANQIQITRCTGCHVEPVGGGESNPMNHIDDPITYVNPGTCFGCHTVGLVPHGQSGLPFEGGIWPQVNCYSCHPNHCETIYGRNDACIWCHTTNPPIIDICGQVLPSNTITPDGQRRNIITGHLIFNESTIENQIAITDCVSCHMEPILGGEANPLNHINDPITYVNNNACFGCHPKGLGIKHGFNASSSYKGQIWPNVDCYSCHPNHCKTDFCSNEACVWCHSETPELNIKGNNPYYKECHKGDCIGCHDTNPQAGECNLVSHSNGLIYVKDGTCAICHTNLDQTHGPDTQNCKECHPGPEHITFNYQDNLKCMKCHPPRNKPYLQNSLGQYGFSIVSDYGCGEGLLGEDVYHNEVAYKECTRCHFNEYLPNNHTISPNDVGTITDVSGMMLNWTDCGLCHSNAQKMHNNIPPTYTCDNCHSGTSKHACIDLNYCQGDKCRSCHLYGTNAVPGFARLDLSSPTLAYPHSITVYESDCAGCHGGECQSPLHLDTLVDVSTMQFAWNSCGLCHTNDQAIHSNCTTMLCNECHSGETNHLKGFSYCLDSECRCCHLFGTNATNFPRLDLSSPALAYPHTSTAYESDCAGCHISECEPPIHLDQTVEVSNMPSGWNSCGLCHADDQAIHSKCTAPTCNECHTVTDIPNHLKGFDYCADSKCRCCHNDTPAPPGSPNPIVPPTHYDTQCQCNTCHSPECAVAEHDPYNSATSLHPLDPLFYNYTGFAEDAFCDCCHGYPPQAKCVGISATQDHCLDISAGGIPLCDTGIYDCRSCHIPFDGSPGHIYIDYDAIIDSRVIASCVCHGSANLATSGAHTKHFTTQVMPTVYPGSSNVIDCGVCHQPGVTLTPEHVKCLPGLGTGAPVDFDETLPFIGTGDNYVLGPTAGTGSCMLYCHSNGTLDPSATGLYNYYDATAVNFIGEPPLWNQTTGIVSCGNLIIGTTANPIFQCHGYPPPTHGAGLRFCANCHPTPLVGTLPDNSQHINSIVEVTMGGGGGGGGGAPGGGVPGGGALPPIVVPPI